jgi:cyanophycinase
MRLRSLPLIFLSLLFPVTSIHAVGSPPGVAVPEVVGGSLVIVGGNGMPSVVPKIFIELAGGPDALIVVLPTAKRPVPETCGFVSALQYAGAHNIHVLTATARKDVEAPKMLDVLRQAKGVWFDGGDQFRYASAYRGTKVEPLFHDVLRRGGVIGGTSAGATIQGDYLLGGDDRKQLNPPRLDYPHALNFLPGTAIDQHFAQRNRFADMTRLLKNYPMFLGIGLDEKTAIIVHGHIAEIHGRGKVHFYDPHRPIPSGVPDYVDLAEGDHYDLRARKSLPMVAGPRR